MDLELRLQLPDAPPGGRELLALDRGQALRRACGRSAPAAATCRSPARLSGRKHDSPVRRLHERQGRPGGGMPAVRRSASLRNGGCQTRSACQLLSPWPYRSTEPVGHVPGERQPPRHGCCGTGVGLPSHDRIAADSTTLRRAPLLLQLTPNAAVDLPDREVSLAVDRLGDAAPVHEHEAAPAAGDLN